MARPFKTKICGVTSLEDSRMVAASGVDAIGLNFCEGSPRGLTIEAATAITEGVTGVIRVGVFVNDSIHQMLQAVDQLNLDWLQLHGDEPIEMLRDLPPEGVIRAFRVRETGLVPVKQFLVACDQMGITRPWVLVDAYQPGAYGGTGKSVNWNDLSDWRRQLGGISLVLAGGLRPDNTERAIAVVRPSAVDTASGVESAPGVKEAGKVRAFLKAARTGFEDPSPASS